MPVIKPKTSLSAKFKNAKESVGDFFYDYGDKVVGGLVMTMIVGVLGSVIYRGVSEHQKNEKYFDQRNSALVEAFNNNSQTFTDPRGTEWKILPKTENDGTTSVQAFEILSRTPEGDVLSIAPKPHFTAHVTKSPQKGGM